MKKLLFAFVAILCLVGCNSEKTASGISGYDNSQLTQTIYADQTSGKGDFQFTASESWTTQITTSTKAATPWITLTPASGSAGKVSMKITLEPNTTGADRRAEIRIICGGTSITIVIEQKGTTNPEEPKPDTEKYYVKRIVGGNNGNGIEFGYDAQMRINRLVIDIEHEDDSILGSKGKIEKQEAWLTYQGNKVFFRQPMTGETGDFEETEELTLNAKGYVVECVSEGGSTHSISNVDIPGQHYIKEISTFLYDNNDHLSRVTTNAVCLTENCTSEMRQRIGECTWSNGNMTKAANKGTSSEYYQDALEYSTVKNDTRCNIDLSYVFASTEFYGYIGGGGVVASAFGYIGLRSQYFPSRVISTAGSFNQTYTYKYTTDKDGRIIKCESQREGSSKVVSYTVEYMD